MNWFQIMMIVQACLLIVGIILGIFAFKKVCLSDGELTLSTVILGIAVPFIGFLFFIATFALWFTSLEDTDDEELEKLYKSRDRINDKIKARKNQLKVHKRWEKLGITRENKDEFIKYLNNKEIV
jgi:hypothetical protein